MRPNAPALCFLCHYYEPGTNPDNDLNVPRCKAFPEGIPSEIINGGFDHREPLGDEAITFRLAEGKTEDDVAQWESEVLEIQKAEMLTQVDDFIDVGSGADTVIPA